MRTPITNEHTTRALNLPRHASITIKNVTIPPDVINIIFANLDGRGLKNVYKTSRLLAGAALDSASSRVNRFVTLFIQNIPNISLCHRHDLRFVLGGPTLENPQNFRDIYLAKRKIIKEIEKAITTSIQSGATSDRSGLKQIVKESMGQNQIKELFKIAITFPTDENVNNLSTQLNLLVTTEKEINEMIETAESIQDRGAKLSNLQKLAEDFAEEENTARLKKIVSMIYNTWDENEDITPLRNLFTTLLQNKHFTWAAEIARDFGDTEMENEAFEAIYDELLKTNDFLLAITIINDIPDINFQNTMLNEVYTDIIQHITTLPNLTDQIKKDKEIYELCLCLIELERLFEACKLMKTISNQVSQNVILLAIRNNLVTSLNETLRMADSPEKDQEMAGHCKSLVELNMPGARHYAVMIRDPELQAQTLGFIAERTQYLP